jgi:hypothetical protein
MSLGDWPRKLAAFDDDALAALANKGLVRRAGKDVAKTPPTVVGDDGDALRLDVAGTVVELRLPPAASTCACDAGVCRHILAALIFVRDSAAEEAEAVDVAEELRNIDEAAVAAWAGKPTLKKAGVVLSRGAEFAEEPGVIRVTLPAAGVNVRFLGGGLDALLCDCHAPGPCPHKAAALLAYLARRDDRPLDTQPIALQEHAGAARTREEVRAATITLLEEAVTLGLARLSPATHHRLQTLATSAHGVDLPRLERSLAALADSAKLILARHAAGDSAAFLRAAARCRALCLALATPTAALVGEHRNAYLPVAGSIDLVGLGATRWQTASGYHGLTVYFWEPAAKTWASWTDARPLDAAGFDPASRFESDPPWTGARHPRDAAARRWRVSHLRRSTAGRLATGDNARGLSNGDTEPLALAEADFAQIARRAADLAAPALTAGRRELDDLVLLKVAQWSLPTYDPVKQLARRAVADEAGGWITLELNHGPAAGGSLDWLQADDLAATAVLARLRRPTPDGAVAEPITLWTDNRPTHLTLDAAPRANPTAAVPPPPTDSPLHRRLRHANRLIAELADAGVRAARPEDELRDLAAALRHAGLVAPAAALARTAAALATTRGRADDATDAPAAAAVLDAAHVLTLATDAAGA